MNWEIIGKMIMYVVNSPGFWGSMGFTTATSMLVGALLYDGRLEDFKKGVVTIGTYAFFILLTMTSRIAPQLQQLQPDKIHIAFGGTVTVLIVTVFYILGLGLGVSCFRVPYRLEGPETKDGLLLK